MIDARTGAAPNIIRQPADSHQIRDIIDRQKALELERIKQLEYERLKQEEYDRLLKERLLESDGTTR